MPRPTILTPPLPPQLPGRAWLVVAMRNGPTGTFAFCNFWYFTAQTFPLPNPIFACFTAQDFFNHMALPVQTTFSVFSVWGPQLAWCWDGTVLHTCEYTNTVAGLIPFTDRDPALVVCVVKRAIEAGRYVVGRSFFGLVNSSWSTSTRFLTNLGITHFGGFASVVFGNFTSNGNVWVPCVYTPNSTQQLLPIVDLEVLPPLTYNRKRRTFLRSRPPGGILAPFPTIAG